MEQQLPQEDSTNFKKHIGELFIKYTIENDQKRKFIAEEIRRIRRRLLSLLEEDGCWCLICAKQILQDLN